MHGNLILRVSESGRRERKYFLSKHHFLPDIPSFCPKKMEFSLQFLCRN